jgi:site-specific recombinase XerD
MPRPKPTPHPIEAFLADEALRPLSIANYVSVVRRIEREAAGNAEAWLKQKLNEQTPKRTLTVWRCGVSYYLKWKNQDWVNAQPALKKQPEGKDRQGLEGEQMTAYYEESEKQIEPYRTILLLLPRTGLRSFEICNITEDNYNAKAQALNVNGKRGVYREVPLSKVAKHILDTFIASHPRNPDRFLFWTMPSLESTAHPRRVTPRDVRAVTFKMKEGRTDILWDLSPHMLRHTAATTLLEEGVPAKVIQKVLGHKSARSLDPYLHPSAKTLRDAMEKLK